jgi:succinate dehydrogenase / fumarate reductase membrane anchor subunit
MSAHRRRSDFRRAEGIGAARTGVAHWWAQRVTAVALIPLSLWFASALTRLAGAGYDAFTAWLRAPITPILIVLLLVALFHHLALGLQVVIEDYVHSSRTKVAAVTIVQLACSALAVAGIVSVVRIALG